MFKETYLPQPYGHSDTLESDNPKATPHTISASEGTRSKLINIGVKKMQEARFMDNTAKVEAWIKSLPDSVTSVRKNMARINQITTNIELGLDDTADDDERKLCWETIGKNGKYFNDKVEDAPPFPKARMGRDDKYPTNLRVTMTTSSQAYLNALLAIPTELQAMFCNYYLPHGRTGGVYSNFEAVANYLVDVAVRNMESSIDDGRAILDKKGDWVIKNELPQMTPPPTKEEKEAANAKLEESNE
tara:strand:- start:8425 stop:9159 length:735 start_codon:yes stop_codon:yes gene_type:complete